MDRWEEIILQRDKKKDKLIKKLERQVVKQNKVIDGLTETIQKLNIYIDKLHEKGMGI